MLPTANPDKFEIATQLGATDCVNPLDHDSPIQEVLVGMTTWGLDYTFDCTGNVEVMRAALVRRPSLPTQPCCAQRCLPMMIFLLLHTLTSLKKPMK